jgi:hypothetical protein
MRNPRPNLVRCRLSGLAAGFGLALSSGAFLLLTIPGANGQAQGGNEKPAQLGTADEAIAAVKKEDLNQWEQLLLFGGYQQWPTLYIGQQPSPQADLEEMLSNDRAVKVLESIQKLPAPECEAACQNLFTKAFQVHTNGFYSTLRSFDDPAVKSATTGVCGKLTMLLAMFATADSGNRALLAKQFAQLDLFTEDAISVMDHRQDKATREYAPYFPLMYPPDTRAQVNLLYLVALHERQGAGDLLSQVQGELERSPGLTKGVFPMAGFMPGTSFKTFWSRSSGNTGKVMTNYFVWEWSGVAQYDIPGREKFQGPLIKKLRSMVFSGL